MPLPSVLNGANQCQVLTKRGRQPCKNPAAYGCSSCRMHGAHKSRNVLKGVNHPQYKHGEETTNSKDLRSKKSAMFLYLRDIGDSIGLFKGAHVKGKKPNYYAKLNLEDPAQLYKAILATMLANED